MAKITLKEKLEITGALPCNIIVSSTLIKELEVYGFVNSCNSKFFVNKFRGHDKGLGGLAVYKHDFNGIVNKDCSRLIIYSDFMYQVIDIQNGTSFGVEGRQTPIYKKLEKSTKKMELNVEKLWIPSLWTNKYYQLIKSHYGKGGVSVEEEILKKEGMPSTITAKEGKAILSVDVGAILMKDSSGEIGSIGEEILAVCRYIHTESGKLCYVIYGLDELYFEES